MSNPYPKPNLTFGLNQNFNSQDFPQTDSSCDSSCSNGYIQNIYNSDVIYYNNTDVIYLNSSITLPSGIWQLNYNFPIFTWRDYKSIVFLSTSSSTATAIANRLIISQSVYKSNANVLTFSISQCSNSFVLSIPQTTTYYLYATIDQIPAASTPVFNPTITGMTANPDSSIIISAIFIK
jgi:hypothetical protein